MTFRSMQNAHMKDKNTKKIKDLSLYEIARWYALIDAIKIVSEKCDDRKVEFSTVELKPLELLRYVNVVSDTVYNKLSNGELL